MAPAPLTPGNGNNEELGIFNLNNRRQEKEKGLCCGGSISNLKVPYEKRELMAADAVKQLSAGNPDVIVTACPLCKKTMAKHADGKMKDIAEVVAEALATEKQVETKEEEDLFLSVK